MFFRVLMSISATFLALAGLITSYFPDRVLETHGTVPDGPTLLLIQMMGALYLGFAVLNWMARGFYTRPVALGNFLHFGIVAVILTREAIDHVVMQLATSAAVFGAFAIGFGIVLFRLPARGQPADDT